MTMGDVTPEMQAQVSQCDDGFASQDESDLEPEECRILSRLQSLSIGTAAAPVLAGNQLNITTNNCSNSRIAGVVFEKHLHFESRSISVEDQNGATYTVKPQKGRIYFSNLANYYVRVHSWMTVPDKPQLFATEDLYVGLRMSPMDKSGQFPQEDPRKKKILFEPFSRTGVVPRTVLVRGDTGFGKTTLCRKIAYDWGGQGKTFPWFDKNQTVVLYLDMGQLGDDAVLEDELIKLAIQKKEIDREDPTVVDALGVLESSGRNVILVLDGYVGVFPQLQRQVCDLLESRPAGSVFRSASIVVTSNADIDNETLHLFQRNFVLQGFSAPLALKLVSRYFKHSEDVVETPYQQILTSFGLSRISPMVILILCQCHIQTEVDVNLNGSRVFRELVFRLTKLANERFGLCFSQREILAKLERLGTFFWKCLGRNCRTFSQEELIANLGEDFEFAVLSCLLRTAGTRTGEQGKETWEPTHDVLMETLAVIRLEKLWLSCSDSGNVAKFMSALFPKLPTLHVTCLVKTETGGTIFTLRFRYQQFNMCFEITEEGQRCSVLTRSRFCWESIYEKWSRVTYQISLGSKANCDRVLTALEAFGPSKQLLNCISHFIVPYRFASLSLSFLLDCESTGIAPSFNVTSHKGAPENVSLLSRTLSLLRTFCHELHVILIDRACTSTFVSSVVKCVLEMDGDPYRFGSGTDVVEELRVLDTSPPFTAAHVYGPRNTAYRHRRPNEGNCKISNRLELYFNADGFLKSFLEEPSSF